MVDVNDLVDVTDMVNILGLITDKRKEANALSMKITEEFDMLSVYIAKLPTKGKKVLYYIWKNPDTVAGQDTFIDTMLSECGFKNAC